MNGRLLIVDDDLVVTRLLNRMLAHEGYHVTVAASAKSLIELVATDESYDLILARDLLAGMDRYACCTQLRSGGFRGTIILLSNFDTANCLTAGLAAGADDYIVIPFDREELLARVAAHLRRANAYDRASDGASEIRISPGLVLDLKRREAAVQGEPAHLTAREFALLNLLAHQPNTALKKSWLFQQVWGNASERAIKALAVTVRRLRKKIEKDPARPAYIVTVRGHGYKIVDSVQPLELVRSYQDEVDELREIIQALVLSGLSAHEKSDAAQISAQRLHELVNGVEAIVWEANAETWQFTFVSHRAEAMLGYPVERWLAEADFWSMLIHPLDRAETLAFFQSAALENEDFEVEYRVVTADGREVWLLNLVYVVRDAEGNPRHLRGVIIDTTERNRASTQLVAEYGKERRIADTLQRSMLLKLPQNGFPSLEVNTIYAPCWDEALVGGDFFDAFKLEGEKVALVVGDVAGKGLEAAARTIEVKYALRAYLQEGHSATAAFALINDFVCKNAALNGYGDEVFIVLSLAVLDQATGETEFISAGAEPPLILRDGAAEPIEIGGLPLGVLTGSTYVSAQRHVARGETILMATDGITEARVGMSFLGWEGMAQLAHDALPSDSLENVGQSIVDGARAFAGGLLRDDACLLIARRN